MSLDEFRAKICDSMGRPQRKLMCFQANPTAESLDKFPDLGSLWVEFCDEASFCGYQDYEKFLYPHQ